MSEEEPVVESMARGVSPIWIVPIVALLLGIWLAVDAYLEQGPTITIRFHDAEGLEADKTLVKTRNVTVGTVTEVRLADDLEGVVVTAELTPEARRLLREDSQFWVMKAEVRGASVVGLGTLLSGAYVEISPGVGRPTRRREFVGLNERPASPAGTPGRRVRLVSESSGSVSVGSPVLYRGYEVGVVEKIELDVETQRVLYAIFIDAPYDQLVTSNTRFWNASGVSAELSTEGVKLNVGSVRSLLVGGVSFDLPHNTGPGRPVQDNTTFRLYPEESGIHENPFRNSVEYVVSFTESLRGLHPEAPVTYRGIPVGRVIRIMLDDLSAAQEDDSGQPIPVLISLEPGRLALEDTAEGVERTREAVTIAVERGLRATLETGNLLTGAMLVELDYFPDDEPATVGSFLGTSTIPTTSSGLSHIQTQVSRLLAKLNELPVEGALGAAESALEELEDTLAAARTVLASDELKRLPATLDETLRELDRVLEGFAADSRFQQDLTRAFDELKRTLESIGNVAEQLDAQPNSLVFPNRQDPDPEPRAPR